MAASMNISERKTRRMDRIQEERLIPFTKKVSQTMWVFVMSSGKSTFGMPPKPTLEALRMPSPQTCLFMQEAPRQQRCPNVTFSFIMPAHLLA
jgi:hypothetical protein